MAGWLESLEQLGSSALDSVSSGLSDGLASRIKSELNPDAPQAPQDRPETQYDTQVVQPVDGPEQGQPTPGAADAMMNTLNQYKWFIAGGLGIVAFMAIKGAR